MTYNNNNNNLVIIDDNNTNNDVCTAVDGTSVERTVEPKGPFRRTGLSNVGVLGEPTYHASPNHLRKVSTAVQEGCHYCYDSSLGPPKLPARLWTVGCSTKRTSTFLPYRLQQGVMQR